VKVSSGRPKRRSFANFMHVIVTNLRDDEKTAQISIYRTDDHKHEIKYILLIFLASMDADRKAILLGWDL
jgi:hypothetical protein